MRAMRTKRRIVPGLGRICTKNAIRIFQKKKIPLSLSLLQKQFICLRLRSLYEIRTFEARRGETIKSRLQIESAPNRLLRIFRQAYDSPYAKNCIH